MMRFWWVNQNQTFDQEVEGGYMWSPQRRSDGARHQFYENMREVEPGDLVFSFKAQHIPCLGIVQTNAYEAPKPDEFGESGQNWAKIGWRVDVRYRRLRNQIQPKAFIEELRPTLPSKYAPLTHDGKGLQSVYLASVPPEMAEILIQKIGAEAEELVEFVTSRPRSEDEEIIAADQVESRILGRPDISETEKETLVKARRGQGAFRQRVLSVEPECRVTGVRNPALLIASHIKPWHRCNTNDERLDPNNGLMLTPNADYLFDRGLITFEDGGTLTISEQLQADECERLGLTHAASSKPFSSEQLTYLAYHQARIFRAPP